MNIILNKIQIQMEMEMEMEIQLDYKYGGIQKQKGQLIYQPKLQAQYAYDQIEIAGWAQGYFYGFMYNIVNIIQALIFDIIMNSKKQRKIAYNSRKKAIFADKKAPMATPDKLVWVINMQGSTFMQVSPQLPFQGNPQILQTMKSKIMPQMNKNISKLWLLDQQQTFKSQIFPFINRLIQYLLVILALSFIFVLLSISLSSSPLYYEILCCAIFGVWVTGVVIAGYTLGKGYERVDYDTAIVTEIRQTLCEYNNFYFADKGYVAKCDQWGIWVSVARIQQQNDDE